MSTRTGIIASIAAVAIVWTSGHLASQPASGDEHEDSKSPASSSAGPTTCPAVFHPPAPHEAPGKFGEAVMLGYHLMTQTSKYAPKHVGNKLECGNCHFDGGLTKDGLTLVGVAAKYPKWREREDYSVDLVERTNNCFERSLNGTPLPPNSKEMQAIMAYYHWISKGIPIYAEIPWLGLKPLTSKHAPNKAAGQKVFSSICATCHGSHGQGEMAPPLWGKDSFNDGAGMSHLPKLAAFAHAYMPKGNPDLTEAQALDAAAFVTSQPRPHFQPKSHEESNDSSSSHEGDASDKSASDGGT